MKQRGLGADLRNKKSGQRSHDSPATRTSSSRHASQAPPPEDRGRSGRSIISLQLHCAASPFGNGGGLSYDCHRQSCRTTVGCGCGSHQRTAKYSPRSRTREFVPSDRWRAALLRWQARRKEPSAARRLHSSIPFRSARSPCARAVVRGLVPGLCSTQTDAGMTPNGYLRCQRKSRPEGRGQQSRWPEPLRRQEVCVHNVAPSVGGRPKKAPVFAGHEHVWHGRALGHADARTWI